MDARCTAHLNVHDERNPSSGLKDIEFYLSVRPYSNSVQVRPDKFVS
jgi:hypothetical protein